MDSTDRFYDLIFGPNSTGATASARAATSDVLFVRGQDELSLFRNGATGRVLTAGEALDLFGEQALRSVVDEGSAILVSSPTEPARTLRTRREALGLSQADVAKRAQLDAKQVEAAEDSRRCNPIRDLERIAQVLSLDDRCLTISPGARGDISLAHRLKSRGGARLSPGAVMTLSEAAWVVATEHRLHAALGLDNKIQTFDKSDDYGDAVKKVYEHARDLARNTRRKLNLAEDEPIRSMRELCMSVRVPLVRAALPAAIAGATVENNGVRGIVVNSADHSNNNVLVQRATVAHELGHLLYDPYDRLSALIVDKFDDVERPWYESDSTDYYVEARANAFAIELIAPRTAVRGFVGNLNTNDPNQVALAIRRCMDHFGLSFTALSYQLWNTYDRLFDREALPSVDPVPNPQWETQERYQDDYFPISATPQVRRGPFAAYLVRAQRAGLTTTDTAAFYLKAGNIEEYTDRSDDILQMYPN
jgi:Zn-dependent peptidase ImmA (M78 family)